MFSLDTATKAKLVDIEVLSQKNRQPDEDPGAKLTLSMDLPNRYLSEFEGHLLGWLFCKNGDTGAAKTQGQLDGVEAVSDLPDLTKLGSKIGTLKWADEFTGYALTIDRGLGGKRSNLEVEDCTLSNFTFKPKSGGTFTLKFWLESANVSEGQWGKLAKLKSREIDVLLAPPSEAQQDLDAVDKAPPAAAAKAGGKDATDQFIDRHAPAATH